MSVYLVKGKGWRYDFTDKGIRRTETWFKTKKAAKEAEAKKREELKNPKILIPTEQTPIDMGFLELIESFSHTDSHTEKKDPQATSCKSLKSLVRPAGFEPAAYGFEVRRSIQLSYGRIKKNGVSDGT
jgi:hypothetical protein